MEVEKSRAEKNKPYEFSDKKISLAQAEEFYNKSVKYAVEKEGQLAAVAMERDRSFKPQFKFNEDLQQRVGAMTLDEFIHRVCDSSSLGSGTDGESYDTDHQISPSQATKFYHRAVKYAMEKDDRLAAMAFERDRSYKAQFNFNQNHARSGLKQSSPSENSGNSTVSTGKKMPVDKTDEFYYKAIKRAIKKEERLAAIALESDRSYHALYNFNSGSFRDSR